MSEINLYTWSEELPDKPGRYVVKTVSKLLGTEHVLLANFFVNDKGEKNWNFKNQLFKSYLQHYSEKDAMMLPDIRNKLSPLKNLISMIENGLVKGNVEIYDLVLKEIEQCKKSIEYLSQN